MRVIALGALAWCASISVFAQLPDFYKRVSRVTWVVDDIGRVTEGWKKLGLMVVEDIGETNLPVEYRGKNAEARVHWIVGALGDTFIDFVQPLGGENAYSDFLRRHGSGVFALVHQVPSMDSFDAEVERLRTLGVRVLQRGIIDSEGREVKYAYMDTEPEGKYVVGLTDYSGSPSPPDNPSARINQFAFVIRDVKAVSAFWQKLGFPPITVSRSSPRELRYRGKPAHYVQDLGFQHHNPKVAYEWCVPPPGENVYSNFLKAHGEGLQHIGRPVPDMDKAISAMRAQGFLVAQSGGWGEAGKPGSGRFAYMDTDALGGLTVELLWSQD